MHHGAARELAVIQRRKKGPKDWFPKGSSRWDPVWPEFVDAYLEAALWTAMAPNGRPMDEYLTVDNFSNEAVDQAITECDDFVRANKEDLESIGTRAQHGHDFSLSRNGHGAGFFDRGYGDVGERLQEAARVYGSIEVYQGDDGLLYFE